MRENVFTLFARAIENYSQHKLTKAELFKCFVACLEMADDDEIAERKNHENALVEFFKNNGNPKEVPYSNYAEALNSLL